MKFKELHNYLRRLPTKFLITIFYIMGEEGLPIGQQYSISESDCKMMNEPVYEHEPGYWFNRRQEWADKMYNAEPFKIPVPVWYIPDEYNFSYEWLDLYFRVREVSRGNEIAEEILESVGEENFQESDEIREKIIDWLLDHRKIQVVAILEAPRIFFGSVYDAMQWTRTLALTRDNVIEIMDFCKNCPETCTPILTYALHLLSLQKQQKTEKKTEKGNFFDLFEKPLELLTGTIIHLHEITNGEIVELFRTRCAEILEKEILE